MKVYSCELIVIRMDPILFMWQFALLEKANADWSIKFLPVFRNNPLNKRTAGLKLILHFYFVTKSVDDEVYSLV